MSTPSVSTPSLSPPTLDRDRSDRPVRRTAAAVLALAVLAGTWLVAPVTADAANFTIRGTSRANVRTAPTVSAPIVRRLDPGTTIDVVCQGVGDRFGSAPYPDNRTWNRLRDGTWVHDMLASTPGGRRENLAGGGYAFWTPSLPRCGSSAPPPAPPARSTQDRAVSWALAQVGRGDYDYWCLKFSLDAYRIGAGRTVPSAGWARQWWDQRPAQQRRGDASPPKGALVFWNWTGTVDGINRNWGHVGVSLGDGRVVSSRFSTGRGVHVFRLSDARSNYLGWIMP